MGAAAIGAELDRLRTASMGYAEVEAINDADLRRLGPALAGHKLVTGSSVIAVGLPDNFRRADTLAACCF